MYMRGVFMEQEKQIEISTKLNSYHSYLQAINLFPEIKELNETQIIDAICHYFESLLSNNSIESTEELNYKYVVWGLLPLYANKCDRKLLNKSLKHLEVAEKSNDNNLLRDVYIAKAKVLLYLGDLAIAEEYVINAYNDYDYRKSTFILLIKILDLQCKFKQMIFYANEYCLQFYKFHPKLFVNELDLKNIQHSNYFDELKQALGE